MRRAALSISNNIAEGNDKKSKKEKAQYFSRASDSTRECVSMCNVLHERNLIDNVTWNTLHLEGRQITSMIHALIEGL